MAVNLADIKNSFETNLEGELRAARAGVLAQAWT
jgi:hypothetical protein